LYQIVTDDKKWIYCDNPERKESWILANHRYQLQNATSIEVRFCYFVWWDMKGVIYYELLKPNQTITAECYQQLIDLNCALNQKRPIIAQRKPKVILLTILDYTLQKQLKIRYRHFYHTLRIHQTVLL